MITQVEVQEEYQIFRELYLGKFLIYEKIINKFGNIFKFKPPLKEKEEFEKLNEDLHLNVTFEKIFNAGLFFLFLFILLGILLIFVTPILTILFIIIGILIFYFIINYPYMLYKTIEKKKEGQLIFAILYMAMKMKENPNLEVAFKYAAKHLQPPLKLDFLRLLWEIYIRRFSSIYEALDYYLKKWKDKADYFIIGMELLISSTYEVDPIRRDTLIDKAIEESLSAFYDKLSEYARELQIPINMIYMLGIVLPTLVLTLFPIMSALMSDIFSPTVLFFFFDVLVPLTVYFLINKYILEKRSELSSTEDLYLFLYMKKHEGKIKLNSILLGIFIFFLLIYIFLELSKIIRDFSILSILVSSSFILGLGIAISVACKFYFDRFKDFVKRLESIDKEIHSFLFSLGNRLMEGVPIEQAFLDIYKNYKETGIGKFILAVYKNVKLLGMSLYDAIFDKEKGALIQYPSSLLEAAMEVIVESAKFGPEIAGKACIAIARYFIYLHRIKMRILDLLAEVTANMKSLAKIIAPCITGVIVGMSIMSLVILYKLGIAIENIKMSFQTDKPFLEFYVMDVLDLLTFKANISPSLVYLIIGLYNILVTYLLAYMLNIIENGRDFLREKEYIAQYMFFSTILFTLIATTSAILLWKIGESVMSIIS